MGLNLHAQEKITDLRKVENKAFKAGEKAQYLVHYGPIDAGIASIEIRESKIKIKGREMYHIVGVGRSGASPT